MRIAVTLAAALLAVAAVTGALGHAAPERFQPSPGQVLDSPPARVEGWFTQDIRRQADKSFLWVYRVQPDGSLGDRVDAGETAIDDNDRRHMSVDVRPGLGAGEYAVAWQTLSDEDDEADGACYRFFVGEEAAAGSHGMRSRLDVAGECPTAAVSAPTAPTATIMLEVPKESAGGTVTIRLSTDVTIRAPTGTGRDPRFGHYHLYLDQAPQLLHSHAATNAMATMTPTPDYSRDIMTMEDSYTFKDLAPGNHVVFAALFYDDHAPFDPSVVTGATFRVSGSVGGDGGAGTGAVIAIAAGAAVGGLLLGGAAAWAARRRRSRPGPL
ncbi:MAG TPA: copper resistance protein CopC [Dehalococcoidia bacterium]|nr:copper resistance protein CopC [Dehalococcoidia bacterium]